MELIAITITTILLFFAVYGMILVLAGMTHKTKEGKLSQLPTIKLLLPAYKPDQTFLKVLESIKIAMKKYPVEVFILFQEADQDIVKASKAYDFEYTEKSFSHLDGNSYRHALQYLCDEHLDSLTHQYTLILDKDNIMDPDFFDRLATASLHSQ